MKLIKKLFSFFWDRSLLIFLIIGGLNTIVSMGLNFVLKTYAGWPLFWSSAFAFAVCTPIGFYFNRKYSFKSKAPLWPSFFKVCVIVTACFLLSFVLNNFAMPWMHDNWFPNINPTLYSLVEVVGIQVVFTVLNYLGQRLWAFRDDG